MKLFKPKFWSRKNSLISSFLLPVSFLLQLLIILKNKFCKKEKFSIPVICVGNIYLGGTGKTPLSIEIVKILKKIKKRGAIIKKFYKEHADEFKLIISSEVQLFINPSRSLAIKEAEANKVDCVVLDDGLQDYSIVKDLNIVCFNEEQLIGNGRTLPSGPLREPFSSLKNSQIIVINGNKNLDFEDEIKKVSNNASIYYSRYLPINLDKFINHNLLAFAGIGNNENFFKLLQRNNLKITKKIFFPDHYNYSLKDLNELIDLSLKNNLKLITTKKDFFRINHYDLNQFDYLDIKLVINNQDKFEKEIITCL